MTHAMFLRNLWFGVKYNVDKPCSGIRTKLDCIHEGVPSDKVDMFLRALAQQHMVSRR